MVQDINKVYSHFAYELLPSLKRKAERSEDIFYSDAIQPVPKKCNRDEVLSWESCCIVASSGMLNGGRSKGYFERLANNPANLIAITGYQAEGTLGRRLQDLTKATESTEQELKLDDEKSVSVKCQVKSYSLSAHADRDQLTALVEKMKPRKLFLVHGDHSARQELFQTVEEKSSSVDIEQPKNGGTYIVKHHPGIAGKRKLPHDKILSELYGFLAKNALKGPFSARELTEIWFGTKAMTLERLACFQLFLWLKLGRYVGDSDLFYPKELV